MIQPVFFYLIALAVLYFAWYAVSGEKLLNAALALAFSFFAIGGLYFLLGVPFLGMLQILINAGAIPIVTVFIIMMTQSRIIRVKSPVNVVGAIIAIIAFANALAVFIIRYTGYTAQSGAGAGTDVANVSSGKIGELLLSSPETMGQNGTLLAFEVASVVLLVAMVGAIVLTKREGETIKGEVGVISDVEKPVLLGELDRPALTIEQELDLERRKAGA